MIVSFSKTGSIGIVKDVLPHELPQEAWSEGLNVACKDGSIERVNGFVETYATPTVTPYGLFPVWSGSEKFWIYPGLAKAYMVEGATPTHTDITNAGADYTGTAANRWNGTILGGLPIITNGVEDPQLLSPVSVSTNFVDLTNWPASTICQVIRQYKNHLVALDITKTATNYPHMVKWSHPAVAGAVPSSWDETDATKDAGEYNIADSTGKLVDCMVLGEQNIIYKENTTWSMQHIGPPLIFRFSQVFAESGMLAQGCSQEFNGGHLVLTGGDVIVHNGVSAQTILNNKLRQWLFSQIDDTNYKLCFVLKNWFRKEMYICFPSAGNSTIDMCMIWNWATNTTSIKELPNLTCAASGIIEGAEETTYATATDTYATTTKDYGGSVYRDTMPRLLMGKATNLYMDDEGKSFGGTDIRAYCEKTGLSMGIADRYKLVKSVRPRFDAATGTTIKIYVGTQETLDAGINWGTAQTFTVGTDYKVDFLKSTRYVGVRFETVGGNPWRLNSFDMDIEPEGLF